MVLLERDANVLSIGMSSGVFVVSYISALRRKDAVIAAEFAVLAGEPCGAALAEYNVARDYIFAWSAVLAVLQYGVMEELYVPPLFLAPNRFPGPSFAPLARPWD